MPSLLSIAFDKPPADAVAYFKSKGYAVTDEWHDMLTHAHSKAFTVARASSMDILSAIRSQLDQALSDGLTAKQFKEQLTPTLQKLGWWGKTKNDQGDEIQLGSPRRLDTIYRVNMQTAYMAGRYRRLLARSKTHPYWQYVAIDDGVTRPEHARLRGRVFRWDDPIWSVIYPPNGWGCRCRVRALTEAQVRERGLTVEDGSGYIQEFDAELISQESGEVKTVPHARVKLPGGDVMTPDLGWAYSPGQSSFGTDVAIANKIGRVDDPLLRAEVVQALNNSHARHEAFESWAQDSIARVERFQKAKVDNDTAQLKANGPRPRHKTVVSFLPDEVNEQLRAKGVDAVRTVVVSERALAHAHSEKHQAAQRSLSLSEYANLARYINDPNTQLLWEPAKGELLYVVRQGQNAIKVVVRFNDKATGLDAVINMFKVDIDAIEAGIKGGLYDVWR
ncbi:phage minor head protein [Pseudoalteromonas ruthenica]|uniref:phage head morphogenesis protein n=1 Tax=Pseudoalteromonas ruthenica TaxID=151081 RepID=UPI000346E275|nr:phage minor head protein [Pseudoalteromonas ruthenica]